MPSRLTIKLTTLTDRPPLDAFIRALGNAHDILRGIDLAVSQKPQGSLRWRIASVTLASATATLDAESVVEDADYGPAVIRAYVEGLDTVERSAQVPPYFTDTTLERAKQFVGILDDEVTKISISTAGIRPITVTQRLAANVDQLIGPKFEAFGSLEGVLETLSVHGRPYFYIYDALTHRGIKCYFSEEKIKEAHDAFGRRVSISGHIKYRQTGEPLSITVDRVRPLRSRSELPQAKDLEGIDLTAGIDATEYIRRLRDAQ